MGAFLPVSSLKGLDNYKYASEDRSLASKYVLKPFYTRIINVIPKGIAPNLITLSGLGFSIISVIRAWYYNYTGKEASRWDYFLYAFELFMYQTLDALDGLQARRTGTSSPLGELFDHCVDAINTSLETYVFSSMLNVSNEMLLLNQFACCLNFFVSTWEEYHTHKLFLSNFSGPVEGVLSIIFLYILTGIKGQHIWEDKYFNLFCMKDVFSAFSAVGLSYNIYAAIKNVKMLDEAKFKQRIAGSVPYLLSWALLITWAALCWDIIGYVAFMPFYCITSAFTALLVGRIITAHVTASDFPMYTPIMLVPVIGIISHLILPQHDLYTILIGSGFVMGVYASFVAEIINEITEYLGINCLTIKDKSATTTKTVRETKKTQ